MFKTEDGYKFELRTPGTMKIFGEQKIDKTKNGENVQSLKVVVVVLVQFSLVNNQYQKNV